MSSAKSFLNTLTNPTGVVNQAANNAINVAKNSLSKSNAIKTAAGAARVAASAATGALGLWPAKW